MKKIFFALLVIIIINIAVFGMTKPNIGDAIDEFNGHKIYYNGMIISKSFGRNLTEDGYNLGQKYQCVEFIKRYYLGVYNHKMPDTYGHAVDFFDQGVKDGGLNKRRGLTQYTNPSKNKPHIGDIVVLNGGYGHVGIVSKVAKDKVELVQQNVRTQTRVIFPLEEEEGRWKIKNGRVLGWLRMTEKND